MSEQTQRYRKALEQLKAIPDAYAARLETIKENQYLTREAREMDIKRLQDEYAALIKRAIENAREAQAALARERQSLPTRRAPSNTDLERARQIIEMAGTPQRAVGIAVEAKDADTIEALSRALPYLTIGPDDQTPSPEKVEEWRSAAEYALSTFSNQSARYQSFAEVDTRGLTQQLERQAERASKSLEGEGFAGDATLKAALAEQMQADVAAEHVAAAFSPEAANA